VTNEREERSGQRGIELHQSRGARAYARPSGSVTPATRRLPPRTDEREFLDSASRAAYAVDWIAVLVGIVTTFVIGALGGAATGSRTTLPVIGAGP